MSAYWVIIRLLIKFYTVRSLIADTHYWIVCRGYLPDSAATVVEIGAITIYTVDDSNV